MRMREAPNGSRGHDVPGCEEEAKRMAYCPQCQAERSVQERLRNDTVSLRGEVVTVRTPALQCLSCHTWIADAVHDATTLRAVYAAYRARHHWLTPDAIRALRVRYGLSQRGLATLLGWSAATIARYEAGALQTVAHEAQLRQLEDPQWVLHALDGHAERLSCGERQRVRVRVQAGVDSNASPLPPRSHARCQP